MTSQLQKDLDKLNEKERQLFADTWRMLLTMEWDGLGVQKLSGTNNAYRKRIGRYRVIFLKTDEKRLELYRVVKRDESTYK